MDPIIGVTGMGIVSSIGRDITEFECSLKKGISGIKFSQKRKHSESSKSIVAEIENFSFMERLEGMAGIPEEVVNNARRLGRRSPYVIQTSILSALEAWVSADLFDGTYDKERVGVLVAGQNSTQNYQHELTQKFLKNPEYLSPRYALEFLETNQVGVLSELLEIHGEGFVIGGASATGNLALIKAFQSLNSGMMDAYLVVGVLADLSPMDMQGFINIGAMGGKNFRLEPEKACRPFDKDHEGFIYGEASACMILETKESSEKRKAPFAAEVCGGAINLDGNSSANPNITGEIKAMQSALDRCRISASTVDYLNTHGSSSSLGDKTEAEAIASVFKNTLSNLWLNATKGLTGHCLYSAGMVEAIATILQIKGSFIHGNKNLEEPIDHRLQFVGAASIDKQIDYAVSNSFGFGGINTSIVFKATNN